MEIVEKFDKIITKPLKSIHIYAKDALLLVNGKTEIENLQNCFYCKELEADMIFNTCHQLLDLVSNIVTVSLMQFSLLQNIFEIIFFFEDFLSSLT